MIYRLGTIEVDPANFRLTANGESVPVEPLVFDLIVCLIEHRDRVLTRQELFDRIWPGRIVSDTSLSNHIKSARKALGDDGQRQRVISTVHGRGYRLIAEVEEVDSHAIRPGTADIATPADRPSRAHWAAFSVLLLLLAFLGARILMPGQAVESIAVLPLQNLSNDPAQAYFVEGMQDALINRLSRITELRVISKTSTMRYAAGDKSTPEIARELNVDALVEGSVLRDEQRLRISAQLIRGETDEQMWTGSYDRELDQVLILIDEISAAISDEVEAAVRPEQLQERNQGASVAVEVHELVLRGRHYFDRFMFDESLVQYQKAVDADPGFAPAHAGVAGSYILMEMFNRAPDTDLVPLAREAALRAIALDSNSAEGLSALGFIQLYFDWDWASAQNNLLRALAINPNDSATRHGYADYLMVMGDLEGSLKQLEIGLLYDPLSPMASSVVDYHKLLLRRYDEIIENGRKLAAIDPEVVVDLPYYREALWLGGTEEQAYDACRKTWGRDPELAEAMDTAYSATGISGAMRALADAMAAKVPGHDDYLTIAKFYVRAGDTEKALTWLEEAYRHRQPQILHIKATPVFDELSREPKFQALLRQIGFPDGGGR